MFGDAARLRGIVVEIDEPNDGLNIARRDVDAVYENVARGFVFDDDVDKAGPKAAAVNGNIGGETRRCTIFLEEG